VWVRGIADHRNFLRVLEKFDVVMLYYTQSCGPLSKCLGRRCVYLPPGVDSILFCPFPASPDRVVDVYSIGRRSEITHRKLLEMAQDGLFYLHDTISGDQSIDSKQHRALFANIAKRSRYFLVNPGLIDQPKKRGNQIEIGNRYFEGAAAGTILIGERPSNGEFERLFHWPDALIHLPYDSSESRSIIEDLDSQPGRQEKIRRTNVAHSLLKNDWVYRWESILGTVGLEPTRQVLERKEYLTKIAETMLMDEPLSASSKCAL
jgi:glycosyl transferase family 1